MTHRSLVHTIAREANGDVSVLLFRSDTREPRLIREIARVSKYALFYGCAGVGRPKIQRDERGDAKEICTKPPNATAARRMVEKAECMVEAGGLPLWGCTEKFRMSPLSGFRKLQKDGETGTHTTPIGKYRNRAFEDGHVPLYEYVCRSGCPCFYRGSSSPAVPAFRWFRSRDATSAQAVARGGRPQGGTRGYMGPRIQQIPRV